MSDELMYTSAPRGLRPGSSGFCTVAATASLGPAWIERLESISGYKPMFAAGDPRESENPVSFAHMRVTVAGQPRSVLSRICFSGFDHTGRSNKFAHHLVLNDRERAAAGPAWMMRQPGLMTERWDGGEPRAFVPRASLPDGQLEPRPALTWRTVTGDAGWAGVLAGYAAEDPTTIVYVIYEQGTDVLALVDEAIRLLPESRRWQVTFNTYLTESPSGIACAWRFVVRGSDAAELARGNVLNLGTLAGAEVPATELVDIARTGHRETAKPALPASSPIRRAETTGGIQSPTYAVASEPPSAGRVTTLLPRNLQIQGSTSRPPTSRRRQIIFSSAAAAACLIMLLAGVYVLSSRHDASLAATTLPTTEPALRTAATMPATSPSLMPPKALDTGAELLTAETDRIQSVGEKTSSQTADDSPKLEPHAQSPKPDANSPATTEPPSANDNVAALGPSVAGGTAATTQSTPAPTTAQVLPSETPSPPPETPALPTTVAIDVIKNPKVEFGPDTRLMLQSDFVKDVRLRSKPKELTSWTSNPASFVEGVTDVVFTHKSIPGLPSFRMAIDKDGIFTCDFWPAFDGELNGKIASDVPNGDKRSNAISAIEELTIQISYKHQRLKGGLVVKDAKGGPIWDEASDKQIVLHMTKPKKAK